MNNASSWRLWGMRASFAALSLLILLGNMLPLHTFPRGWAGPDLLLCLGMAWSVRRAEFVPLPFLALIFLLCDFLLFRPPGLGAALMVYACYNLQNRAFRLRDAGFLAEWSRVAMLVLGVAIVERLVLAVLLIPVPALGLVVSQTVATILCYPLVVFISAIMFGVRVSAPGEIEALGGRP